jgi:hypothetical protein
MGSPMSRFLVALAVAFGIALALPADAYAPILHERVPPDAREDMFFAATTADGQLPAAIETRSGIVRAPDPSRAPPSDQTYREPFSPTGPTSVYHPDEDTRRPETVHYDDPFSPTVAPYKRLRAYDAVAADYGLFVRDTSLSKVPTGGEAGPADDTFYGDLTVDFEGKGPVLVPSVGPGARVLRAHALAGSSGAAAPLELWRDGAENWFAQLAGGKASVRLMVELAIPRAAFGGDFAMPRWDNLPAVPALPPNVAEAARTVAKAIGVSRSMPPGEVVRTMVAYFRSFVPSDEPPRGHGDVYLDLALSQKGVCRHRAFAFLVTALGMGIPARMVMNEAHAWVEVRGLAMWQRIDLGGAAGQIDAGSTEDRPAHAPPSDPFEWPAAAEASRGRDTLVRTESHAAASPGQGSGASGRGGAGAPGAPGGGDTTEANGETPASPGTDAGGGTAAAASGKGAAPRPAEETPNESAAVDDRPRAEIAVDARDKETHRGEPLRVRGTVRADGRACSHTRIDVALTPPGSNEKMPIGSLTTDDKGQFEGALFLPLSFPVGDYDVVVSTPGDARCGPGRN